MCQRRLDSQLASRFHARSDAPLAGPMTRSGISRAILVILATGAAVKIRSTGMRAGQNAMCVLPAACEVSCRVRAGRCPAAGSRLHPKEDSVPVVDRGACAPKWFPHSRSAAPEGAFLSSMGERDSAYPDEDVGSTLRVGHSAAKRSARPSESDWYDLSPWGDDCHIDALSAGCMAVRTMPEARVGLGSRRRIVADLRRSRTRPRHPVGHDGALVRFGEI